MGDAGTNLLRRALRLVEEHAADAYAGLTASLEGLTLDVSLGAADRLVLRCSGGSLLEEAAGARRAEIRIGADREAMRALISGRATLNESLRSGAIELAGTAEALGRAATAFEYFVCALLRIDEAEELRRELLG